MYDRKPVAARSIEAQPDDAGSWRVHAAHLNEDGHSPKDGQRERERNARSASERATANKAPPVEQTT